MRRIAPLVCLLLALIGGALWLVMGDGGDDDGKPSIGAQPANEGDSDDEADKERNGVRARVRVSAGADAADERRFDAPEALVDAFVLRVVTTGDERPVRGLVVDVVDAAGRAVRTNAKGFAIITAEEGEERLTVSSRAPGAENVELTRGVRVVSVPPPVPVDVRYVDAESGIAMRGGSRGVADGDLFPVWPGQVFDFRFPPFRAPDGYASPTGPQRRRRGRLSPFAQRAIATVPVAREAKIRVQVVNDHGLVVPSATATVATLTGPVRAVATNDDGDALVGGMPFHRGEFVHAAARYKLAGGQADPVVLADAASETLIQIVLNDSVRRFRPPRRSRDADARPETFSEGDPGGTGEITVPVRRRDGTRAARAEVTILGPWRERRAANADGMVQFPHLPAGTYKVSCSEAGMLPVWDSVELGIDEERTLDLAEPRGRTLRVRVVDANGDPLPFARIRVGTPFGTTWTRMEGAEQSLDIFTDELGAVALINAPDGAVPITASYGSRSARTEAGSEGDTIVTIPDAKSD